MLANCRDRLVLLSAFAAAMSPALLTPLRRRSWPLPRSACCPWPAPWPRRWRRSGGGSRQTGTTSAGWGQRRPAGTARDGAGRASSRRPQPIRKKNSERHGNCYDRPRAAGCTAGHGGRPQSKTGFHHDRTGRPAARGRTRLRPIVAIPAAGAATVLGGMEPDQTLWLSDVFVGTYRAGAWTGIPARKHFLTCPCRGWPDSRRSPVSAQQIQHGQCRQLTTRSVMAAGLLRRRPCRRVPGRGRTG
jgi:hypothetical protein